MLQMRDYSLIPITPHKWENWDCCPDHLRIDMNHKTVTEPRCRDDGNATRDLAFRHGLNAIETKAAFILAGISGHAWQKRRSRDHDLVDLAMINYKAMIPANGITLAAYDKKYHRSQTWIIKLVKERGIQPIAKLVDMSYYAVEDIHSLYKEKP
jgi:hypothetical protein